MAGFFTSSIIFYTLNKIFPVAGMGEYDEADTYGTFTEKEAAKHGVIPADHILQGTEQYAAEDGSMEKGPGVKEAVMQ